MLDAGEVEGRLGVSVFLFGIAWVECVLVRVRIGFMGGYRYPGWLSSVVLFSSTLFRRGWVAQLCFLFYSIRFCISFLIRLLCIP